MGSLVNHSMEDTHVHSENLINLMKYVYLQKKANHARKTPSKHTVAHFIIDCSSKSQVVIFNLNFNMICGSLLLSP